MSTVYKELAEEIIANKGYYENDPRVMQVIKYQNSFGGESWAILYKEDVLMDRYAESEFIQKPEIVWSVF